MKLLHAEAGAVARDKSEGAYSEHTADFLSGVVESSEDLFAAIGPDLRLVAFNAAFLRGITELCGVSPHLRQELTEVLPGFAATSGTLDELCRQVFAGEAVRFSFELAGKEGKPRCFDASLGPVRDSTGSAVVAALALRDVTDKRSAERKFHGILQGAPDAMLVVREGVIEFANTLLEKMFGYGKEALRGAPLEFLVPESLRQRHVLQRLGYEQGPRTRPMGVGLDLLGLRSDGTEFPVEISLSPMVIDGEKFVIAAVRDISARKRAETELRNESLDLRNQLVISHRMLDAPSDLEVYRVSFDKAAAAILHYLPDGRIIRVNEHFCGLLGFRSEELLQRTMQNITHPDDVAVNTDLDIKVLAGTLHSYHIDKRLLRKDNTVVCVCLAVSVHRTPTGQPDFLIGVAEDITERRQTEDALREAQVRLTVAAEIARVGSIEMDLASKEIRFSPELKRQLGLEDIELPNRFSALAYRLHPEDSRRVTLAIRRLIAKPQRGLVLEYRLRHKDGRYRWFSARGAALEDVPGHAYRLFITQVDVTERKSSEKRLREQTEELQLALRVGRSGTFQWNAQTHEHYWYDEILELYGLKQEEFGGRDEDWLACLLPEHRASAWAAVEAALTTGHYAAEFRIQRRNDGQIRWISARGQVFFDEEGVPRRMVGINVDVTDERRIRTELEESQARLGAVLNSLNEGVVLFDTTGQVLDMNPAALKLTNLKRAEEARRPIEEYADRFLVRDLDGQIVPFGAWPVNRVMRGEAFTNCELSVRRIDEESPRICSYNGTAIRRSDGTVALGVLTLVDITHRKQAEQALKDSEQRLSLALKASNTAVWELDVATQRIRPAEDLLFTMIGYAPGELESMSDWLSRIHEDDRHRAAQLLDEAIRGVRNGYFGEEIRYLTKDGGWRWILCQMAVASRDEEGKAVRLVGTHTDIDARKKGEERAREASLHDPLTGLPNRALLIEYGGRLLAAAKRSHEQGALLFIDLDRFKPINDQYGHDVGDRVLQEVAMRLIDCTRQEDVVSRIGGDEFVIMLAHLRGGLNRASAVAQHVLDSLSTPFRVNELELVTSPSIGIANYPEHGDTVDALIHASDLAMYRVKESGRAAYQFFTHDLHDRADEVYSLEARLRNALRHDQLALHYQPVVDVKTGKVLGAEALVRLVDGGEASGPSKFIPIAEAAGLISELGEWVANEACRQHGEWRSQGMSLAISINVSPLQFRQRAFPDRLGRIISDSGIDPQSLHLELTESALMHNIDDAVEILNRIKSLGVKVAIDDFGTGYSSLSRLSRLPLDKLKVDQSFVHGIGTNSMSRAVTDAIIALGRNLKLDVIGEGIESKDELAYLEERGCLQAQGFLFSEPLPACEFAQRYREAAMV